MLYAIVALVVILIDQWVKFYTAGFIHFDNAGAPVIPGILSLVNVHNPGAAFSLFSGGNARIYFIIITGVFTLAVIIALATKFVSGPVARWSLVLMTAGGAMYYAADLDGTVTSMGNANWSGWEVRAIGDFSGDGKDDIVAFNSAANLVAMWGDGDAVNQWSLLGMLDHDDWFIVGAGDYDGDKKDDLLVRQYSTGMLGYYSGADQSKWVELGRGVDTDWTVIA